MKVFILLLVFPLVLCSGNQRTVKGSADHIKLVYQKRANNPIEATFALNCEAGPDGSQYQVTISGVDSTADSSASLSANGVQVGSTVTGAGTLTITGNLVDLEEEATKQTCTVGVEHKKKCSLNRKGKVSIKQYIQVPGSKNLHWLGQYIVEIECRLVPKNPEKANLIPATSNPFVNLGECIEVSHTLTITSRAQRSISGKKVTITNRAEETRGIGFMLKKCTMRSGSQEVIFIENGQLVNTPEMIVSGRSVQVGESYEVTFENVSFKGQQGIISCDIEYCVADNDRVEEYRSKAFEQRCPAGALMVTGGNNRIGVNAQRSPSQRMTQNLDFEIGKFVLVNNRGVRCD